MMDIESVFVLSSTKGNYGVNNEVSIYSSKPDLYELMEVISEDINWLTFSGVKHLAQDLYNYGYVSYGFHEYTLKNKAVQYA